MNILLIEDEKDLAETGKAQLEMIGHTVFPAYDLAEARAVMEDDSKQVNLVIADHRLPDGLGVEFILELREQMPAIAYVIVSGCLTDRDAERLEAEGITYFQKPLLYRKVVDQVQRDLLMRKPVAQSPEPAEDAGVENAPEEVSLPEPALEAAPVPEKPGFWQRILGKKEK